MKPPDTHTHLLDTVCSFGGGQLHEGRNRMDLEIMYFKHREISPLHFLLRTFLLRQEIGTVKSTILFPKALPFRKRSGPTAPCVSWDLSLTAWKTARFAIAWICSAVATKPKYSAIFFTPAGKSWRIETSHSTPTEDLFLWQTRPVDFLVPILDFEHTAPCPQCKPTYASSAEIWCGLVLLSWRNSPHQSN